MDTRNGWEYNLPVEHVAGADNIGLLLSKKTKIMKTGKQQEFTVTCRKLVDWGRGWNSILLKGRKTIAKL